jgi:flagellar biosynthesis/type III secretory pathway protein FliH
VIRAEDLGAAKIVPSASPNTLPATPRRRVVPREELEARAAATAIIEAAKAEAVAILDRARAEVADVAAKARREAIAEEHAKLSAAWLALRAREERREEVDLDRAVKLSAVLTERLIGHALSTDPTTVVHLARTTLAEARGARRATIQANPADAEVLGRHISSVGMPEGTVDIVSDETLPRGSLVVQTELGTVDARLRPQLERLAAALREALGG